MTDSNLADLEKAVVEAAMTIDPKGWKYTPMGILELVAERAKALRTARESVAQPKVCRPLLPCPFCGGEATDTVAAVPGDFWVKCKRCGAATRIVKTWPHANALWNLRRPALPPAEPARGIGLGDNLAPLSDRLNYAATGSCSCLGKRVGIAAHSPLCHYRLFLEAMAFVEDNSVPRATPTVAKEPTDEAIAAEFNALAEDAKFRVNFGGPWLLHEADALRITRAVLAKFSPAVPGTRVTDRAIEL